MKVSGFCVGFMRIGLYAYIYIYLYLCMHVENGEFNLTVFQAYVKRISVDSSFFQL
ncbi:uncharacterized protein J3R85_005626 [Psidium guajava]|nr:uncharacterized protein J3R85_005626 [Psidium guajava]